MNAVDLIVWTFVSYIRASQIQCYTNPGLEFQKRIRKNKTIKNHRILMDWVMNFVGMEMSYRWTWNNGFWLLFCYSSKVDSNYSKPKIERISWHVMKMVCRKFWLKNWVEKPFFLLMEELCKVPKMRQIHWEVYVKTYAESLFLFVDG